MNKNIIRLVLIIILIGGSGIILILDKSNWLISWALGVGLGVYPFFFWGLARTVTLKKGSPAKSLLVSFLLVTKFMLLGAGLFLLSKTQFIAPPPFLAGCLITPPAILLPLIADMIKNNNKSPVVSAKES